MRVPASNKSGSAFWDFVRASTDANANVDANAEAEAEADGCWEWQGSFNAGGYGRLKINGRTTPAHRYAYELAHGPIPAGQVIWHSCGNSRCVRPAHLEALPRSEQRLRTRRASTPERFWSQVEQSPEPEGCWIWQGPCMHSGYGLLSVRGRPTSAHRHAYTLTYGPIPEGLQLIHRCRNTRCVRPDHLELASRAVISQRYTASVTHCKHGHPRTPENLSTSPNGTHRCRACHRDRMRRYWAKRHTTEATDAEAAAAADAATNADANAG